MNKKAILLTLSFFSALLVWSQNEKSCMIPMIGSEAPSFKAESTNGTINFPQDFGKNWKIIFSHPRDFTPVCSSELLELSYLQQDFEKLGVKLIVVSTDNLSQHFDWKASLESITYQGRNPQKINFPIVTDNNYEISRKYGMIQPDVSDTKDVRGVFIIDPENRVQTIQFYPMNVGRNMDEIKRTVEALQASQDNIVIPANWQPGNDVMLSYRNEDQKEASQNVNSKDVYEVAWYMVFKKMQ